jgi:hypothetical protein
VRHVRMLGLCLVAVLALCAYAVSSASAANPEWGKCVAKAGGKYEDSNCTTKAKGKTGKHEYEWLKASQVGAEREAKGKSKNVPFSGKSAGGGGVLTANIRECVNEEKEEGYRVTRQGCAEKPGDEEYITGEGIKVECASETATGEAEGKDKIANVHVKFTGCVLLGSLTCTGEGKAPGEIETSALKGSLGYINKSAKEVGVLLEPAKKHGHFADFGCANDNIGIAVGVGNKKEGAEYIQGPNFPNGCDGANEPGKHDCPGATPNEEKSGGYDGIISPITPIDQMTTTFTQVYTEEHGFPLANVPGNFEGKHIELLEAYQSLPGIEAEDHKSHSSEWSSAGEEITNVNTPEEEGEIKA